MYFFNYDSFKLSLTEVSFLEKIIHQNKDEMTIKYLVVSIFSILTFRRWKGVEKRRMELRNVLIQQELENDDKTL